MLKFLDVRILSMPMLAARGKLANHAVVAERLKADSVG
jgi:hypothetical protein